MRFLMKSEPIWSVWVSKWKREKRKMRKYIVLFSSAKMVNRHFDTKLMQITVSGARLCDGAGGLSGHCGSKRVQISVRRTRSYQLRLLQRSKRNCNTFLDTRESNCLIA